MPAGPAPRSSPATGGLVLLGDSHLARVRRALPLLGDEVVNLAQGGAVAGDLAVQARGRDLALVDAVVVSVGTNDAAPWRDLPGERALADLSAFLDEHTARWVYLESPTVDVARLSEAVRARAGVVVATQRVLAGLGERALAADGLHLTGAAYALLLPALAEAAREVSESQ